MSVVISCQLTQFYARSRRQSCEVAAPRGRRAGCSYGTCPEIAPACCFPVGLSETLATVSSRDQRDTSLTCGSSRRAVCQSTFDNTSYTARNSLRVFIHRRQPNFKKICIL